MIVLCVCVFVCLMSACVSPVSLPVVFQDINKRLSLPADIRLPDGYLEKFNLIGPALFEQPISRRLRRVSLVRQPTFAPPVCILLLRNLKGFFVFFNPFPSVSLPVRSQRLVLGNWRRTLNWTNWER